MAVIASIATLLVKVVACVLKQSASGPYH